MGVNAVLLIKAEYNTSLGKPRQVGYILLLRFKES